MILHKGPGSEGSTYDRLFGQKTQNQFSNFPLIKKKKKKSVLNMLEYLFAWEFWKSRQSS